MCLSRKVQKEESKKSDDSELDGINDLAIKVLELKADKPSNFAIKDNSKHITDLLEWYTDVPVTLKDKEDKTVTVIKNLFILIMVKQNQCYFLVCQIFERSKQGSSSKESVKRESEIVMQSASQLSGFC
ncbi:hypothetical protein C1645_823617 [Glomus cerebriforme]|uniref:Uncharacterized protein n=1 Tax=Glomus cerebriforme TaxID=658196 RepID=A0A397T588_9GLOM|nr:hypothetical protein C1645_823617 [Glomus cerebriforme]